MKRLFTYDDGKSNKFWSIEVNKNSFTVNYGKAGTIGQSQTKDFDSDTEAKKQADKLINEKVKKGYVEQGGKKLDTKDTKAESSAKPDKTKATKVIKTAKTTLPELNLSITPIFRAATKDDLPALIAIVNNCAKFEPIFNDEIQKKLEGKGAGKFINIDYTDVMEIGGVIVGFATKIAVSVIIDPKYRRKGFGTLLLKHMCELMEDYAKKNNRDSISVFAYVENNTFFNKNGFTDKFMSNSHQLKVSEYGYRKRFGIEKKEAVNVSSAEKQKLDSELITATLSNNTDDIAKLLAAGANPNVKDKSVPVIYKLLLSNKLANDKKGVKMFIEYGVDLNVKDVAGKSALHYLAAHEYPGIIDQFTMMLCENGADPKALDNEGRTALFYLRSNFGAEAAAGVRALINCGVDPEVKDKHGRNAIAHVMQNLKLSDVGYAMATNGVPAVDTDNEGNAFLHFLSAADDMMFAYKLENLLKTYDVNIRNNAGKIPLHVAGKNSTKELIENGADINAQDNDGNTPLHLLNDFSLIYILKSNPDLTIINKNAVSIKDRLIKSGQYKGNIKEYVDYLLENPVKSVAKEELKAGFKPQKEPFGKFKNKKLELKGSIVLKDNDGQSGLKHLNGTLIQVVADNWNELTDIIDIANNDVWRIPVPSEKRAVDCFADDDFFYVVLEKGFEAIYRNMRKIDKKTKEIVWECGLSSFAGRYTYHMDDNNIYYTDSKSVFVISKAKGKIIAKTQGKYLEKIGNKIIAPESSYLFHMYTNKKSEVNTLTCGWNTKKFELMFVMLNPITSQTLWELSLGTNICIASIITDSKIYAAMIDGTVNIIDAENGKLLKTGDFGINKIKTGSRFDSFYESASKFYIDNGKLYTVIHCDDSKKLVSIDLKTNDIEAKNIELPYSRSSYSNYEIVKDGIIFCSGVDQVATYNICTGKVESFDAINYGGDCNVIDILLLGNSFYFLQQGGNTYPKGSVLHQLK